MRYRDDWNELYFRDYLIDHKEVAKEYEKLKVKLWKEFEHDRDGYTEAKSNFILSNTEKAEKSIKISTCKFNKRMEY